MGGCAQYWLMESPRFMLLAGQPREAAMQALARARGRFGRNPVVVEAEMDDIAASVKISSEAPGGAISSSWFLHLVSSLPPNWPVALQHGSRFQNGAVSRTWRQCCPDAIAVSA